MTELQRIHRYAGRGFPRVESARDFARWELRPEQVAAFHERGFVAGVKVLEPDQVAELRQRLDHIRSEIGRYADRLYEIEADYLARPDEVVLHFLGAWLIDEWFHDLVFAPAATVPAAQLLGVRRLRFWHDQVFYKPARHPGVVPWHQDYSYWTRAAPANHITINILLDDATPESGCLHFVPGSHRWGLLPKVSFGGDMDALRADLPPELEHAFTPVAAPARAGEASLHHSHTIHGSFGNRSDRPRRAVVLNYMGPETRCADGGAPLLAGVPLTPTGARIEGDYFPIVLDRDRISPP